MKQFIPPKIEVMPFRPDEYISACDGSVTATVTCIHGGSVSLSGGYDNGNGLFTFPSGHQLYTDVYRNDALDESVDGILVGSISEGHHYDASQFPRHDGEYSGGDQVALTEQCGHTAVGADGGQQQTPQHHHLSFVTVHNHS